MKWEFPENARKVIAAREVITARLFVLMVEQSYSCEAHCHAVFVTCLDNIVIADRTTRLCDILDAALVSALDIVAEWEESIRTEADILHLVKPCTFLLTGKYRRLLGEEFLPGAVGENIHVFVEPGGSHRARIGTLPEEEKKQVMELINEWLKQ